MCSSEFRRAPCQLYTFARYYLDANVDGKLRVLYAQNTGL